MSNSACSQQNLNVKHVATLFEEVQNRYVKKLSSIDEKHITADERHKVKHLSLIKKIFSFFLYFVENLSEIEVGCR